jgi:hypothetical protein
MSLNVGDQEYNGGKKYRQKGTLCGPNTYHKILCLFEALEIYISHLFQIPTTNLM